MNNQMIDPSSFQEEFSPQSTRSSGSDNFAAGNYHLKTILGYERALNNSKYMYSNLGQIQQVRAVGKEVLTKALQKRLQNIGKYKNFIRIEFKQSGTRSEQRFDNQYKKIYQEHLKEVNQRRKGYVPDKKLIQFTTNKNPEFYFNLERKSEHKPAESRKPHIIAHRISRRKRLQHSK